MMVAHRKGRDNGLTVRSAPAGMAPAETRRYQEEKMGIGGLAIQTAASAEGALVRQASTLGAEKKETRGKARAGRQASGASASAAESK